MKTSLRGASSAAILVGLSGFVTAFMPSIGQTAPVAQDATAAPAPEAAPVVQTPTVDGPNIVAAERVVVTGQLVAGASEDAPSPVETFSLEDLSEQGAPTAAEFLRSLTISSESFGEADSSIAGAAAGFANVNLRGLGASRTLVLLNGRRFASSDGGNGADINTLPMMAVGRIDVLKDGASVTYGAGAVGGVINYVTRKNFDGLEVSASKKFFADSRGEDNIEVLWGQTSDVGNLLLAGSYGKRHSLGQSKRDFSTMDYQDQPANWTAFDSNPGSYYLGTSTAAIRDYTTASCRAIGGEISSVLNDSLLKSGTGGTAAINAGDCAVPLENYFNLIDEEIYYRGFMSYDADLSDSQNFHFELSYAKTDNPHIAAGNSLPNGSKRALATNTFAAFPNGAFAVPYTQTLYNAAGVATGTSAANPYAVEFFNRINGYRAAAGQAALTPGTLLTHNQWRPLMFGPNAMFQDGHREERQQRERWGANVALKGEFTEGTTLGFLNGIGYEFAGTYSRYQQEEQRPDWLVSRLQNALNGYGGANCKAVDRVATDYSSNARYDATVGIQSDTAPGTNGCEYFNPFASSFQTSFVNGAANPSYAGTGFENSAALLSWMTAQRIYETTSEAMTLDATFTGEIPGFELPGGQIGWAFGTQWRQTEARTMAKGNGPNAEAEEKEQQLNCPWGDQGLPATFPNQGACLAQTGPFFGSGIGRRVNSFVDRQTMTYFGELAIPVLDNLNIQLAARREEFGEIAGNIYKVSAKYDILPELSLRGSYSTNFQAPPEDLDALGVRQGSVYISSLLRSLPTTINTVSGITPEDDTGENYGIIYAPVVFDGQLRMSADFWQFTVLGEIANTAVGTALQRVFNSSTPSQAAVANCGSAFINFFTFSTGSCVQGVTTASTITNVSQYTLNTGGFVTNGIDYNIDYTREVGPGELFAGLSATQVLIYKVKGFGVPGVIAEYAGDFDGLGGANLSGAGTIMPEWRGNVNLRYTIGDHMIGLRANYISGFTDDSIAVRTGLGADGLIYNPAAAAGAPGSVNDDIYADYGLDANNLTTFDLNYIYTSPFWKDLTVRASILNLTDEDPMPAQNTNAGGAPSATRNGYYPGYGDPRGRQFEIGITKKF